MFIYLFEASGDRQRTSGNDFGNKCIYQKPQYPTYPYSFRNDMLFIVLKVKVLFNSTYLCEKSFSNMMLIKNKYRNRLTHEKNMNLYDEFIIEVSSGNVFITFHHLIKKIILDLIVFKYLK